MLTRISLLMTIFIAALVLACAPRERTPNVAPIQPTFAPVTVAPQTDAPTPSPAQPVAAPQAGDWLIVDNADAGFTIQAGEWGTCSGGDCQGTPYGADFRYAEPQCLDCRARFVLTVPHAGGYELHTWWAHGDDRATDTPFTISYSAGTNTLAVDQRNSGDDWFWLQTLDLQAGERVTVIIGGSATGFANADAIALIPNGSTAAVQPNTPAPMQAVVEPTTKPLVEPTPQPFIQPTTQPIVQPTTQPALGGLGANPPRQPMRLVFVHHSTGENWLADDNGGLGVALRDNNYFVSDTNYGWGPDGIGDTTDIGHWWNWFRGPSSANYLDALFAESEQHAAYSRAPNNPGGENQIVMFKSCFPNSNLQGNPNDPPTGENNPLRGQDANSEHMTVAHAKGIYNDLLPYFATRPDKLFVVITAPPLSQNETDAATAANARAFNTWLARDWLKDYPHRNVFVFDFYNVLTSSGGNANLNDAGQESGNHHRVWNGAVQYVQAASNNFSAYPSAPEDSHPTAAGNRKATTEFVPLLNLMVHCWQGDGACPVR